MKRQIKRKTTSATVKYPFATESSVPSGIYRSTIDKIVETESSNNRPCFDVHRTLKNARGKEYRIKERVAFDTPYEDDLAERLVAAGVEEGTNYEDVAGVSERVYLGYDNDGFGHTSPVSDTDIICLRRKAMAEKMRTKQEAQEDEDDEDDEDYDDEDDLTEFFEED